MEEALGDVSVVHYSLISPVFGQSVPCCLVLVQHDVSCGDTRRSQQATELPRQAHADSLHLVSTLKLVARHGSYLRLANTYKVLEEEQTAFEYRFLEFLKDLLYSPFWTKQRLRKVAPREEVCDIIQLICLTVIVELLKIQLK